MQQIKLENGEKPQDLIDWWSGIYKTNISEDIKNYLKARLEKISIAHEEKTKKKETEREKHQLERSLAEEPKTKKSRLKMRLKFKRTDGKDNKIRGYQNYQSFK